ncbi:GAF domain-containing protein [Roseateles sp. DAIF2]|uniref:sigma-54-dependent Fis family transcriptional regulator n=1 Tax=Roseateles sp. DAIF2 TaxID=2714952 RepID=UPI0018A2E287|nr:helix-turn-helix domain-containing protein [Roseateles sp. DAIF2]QPF73829.1 GAF domain-containing protein [Roseateles sp. DAIF2]
MVQPSSALPAPIAGATGHAQQIAASHERCRAFGLASEGRPDLHRLAPSALAELQQRNARLYAQALPVMEMLYEQLMHAQSMVLLTDASGCILHALGDPGFLQRADQVALSPGALWAEADKGSNAVGTTLMTEAPTLVHGQEHYLRGLQFLTCSAAPIFDHKGALLGVLDVSGERRSYHPHTLALAGMSARLIEAQWFADRFRHSSRLHFHPSAAALGTLHEGLLALDEDGRVLGANRRALELLGLAPMALRRESLTGLFGQGLGELALVQRHRGELRLAWARDGAPLCAKLSLAQADLGLQRQQAREAWAAEPELPETPPPPGRVSLRQTERQAIASAVQAAAGNLSEAARQLGIGRSTLYRKLKTYHPAP